MSLFFVLKFFQFHFSDKFKAVITIVKAYIVEYQNHLRMISNISLRVKTVQHEKHMVHGFDRGSTNPVWLVRHYALNERGDASLIIIKLWSNGLNKFIQNFLISSLYISIVESWGIYKCHISSGCSLNTGCYWSKRFTTFERTWRLILSIFLAI